MAQLCGRCGDNKADEQFIETHPWCRDCRNTYSREWKKNNLEHRRKYQRDWKRAKFRRRDDNGVRRAAGQKVDN